MGTAIIHNLYGEPLSEEHWKSLSEAGFQHTQKLVPVTFEISQLPPKRGCEGRMHRALKKVASDMLEEEGEAQVKLEHCGFDVYAVTLGIVVECGTMPITKIYEALVDQDSLGLKEIWNISFPKPENICVLTKIQLAAKGCSFAKFCKPNEWSRSKMKSCRLNGAGCYVRRQYLVHDCLHLNGLDTLANVKSEAAREWE